MNNIFNSRGLVPALLTIALLCFGGFDAARAQEKQEQTVSGLVKDSEGQPVIGAGVLEIGPRTNGTVTDNDGKFTLRLLRKSGKRVIEISCIGYKTQRIDVTGRTALDVVLQIEASELQEVAVVAYGVQRKASVTGAISSVGTEKLLTSPNASVANALAGQLSGVSTVQVSGQPGAEDPDIYVRGAGSLDGARSRPLILVDGIEMSFFQMDPNEIDNISVLKDASATAVFGVRGANGVILVTTKRGMKSRPKIQWTSSVGINRPVRLPENANSFETLSARNEMAVNDGENPPFSDEVLEAFRTHSDPIMYPDVDWYDYCMKDFGVQNQHNVNVSGGTARVKYFASIGLLHQDGQLKEFKEANYDANYRYTRYNYRANLDIDVTRTTNLKLSIGGIVSDRTNPIKNQQGAGQGSPWYNMVMAQPFSSPGFVDGKFVKHPKNDGPFHDLELITGIEAFWKMGYFQNIRNTMNMNLELTQKLDFITKGLSLSIKGAYNNDYTLTKKRQGSIEEWHPYYSSCVGTYGKGGSVGEKGPDDTIVYRVEGQNRPLGYSSSAGINRDWYLEGALRYARKFKGHRVTGLLLYNQSKRYYPASYPENPAGYIGLVTRITYDWNTRYLAEFNAGYNGSENFAPGRRYGFFPALSLGWILTEEPWMKKQHVFNYLKLRATAGLVGNDKIAGGRFFYLPSAWNLKTGDYAFGSDETGLLPTAEEKTIGNPNATWEKAFKQNYGIEAKFFRNRLKFTADYFHEYRRDILITLKTIPGIMGIKGTLSPDVNKGEVSNHGFELELAWKHRVRRFSYWIDGNFSFARNKIIFMDEIEPNEAKRRTGRQTGLHLGWISDGFYNAEDFDADGKLNPDLPDPGVPVRPGDIKYKDMDDNHVIDVDDQRFTGYPTRPEIVYGLNYGIGWKGLELSMHWVGAGHRSMEFGGAFRKPFNGGKKSLQTYYLKGRWTPETAETATLPRFTKNNLEWNIKDSDLWMADASYVRLKSVELSYTLSGNRFLKQLGISGLKVYTNGYNLLTFDKVKVIDPEARPTGNYGVEYPISQTFNFGFVLNF